MTPNTNAAPDLRLFDAYTFAGICRMPPIRPALTPKDLLDEMDRCGVDEAMVFNNRFEGSDPSVSNPDAGAFCAASPRLHPVWHIAPPQTDFPVPAFLEGMRAAGVRLLAATPDAHRYLLNGLTFGPLFDALIEKRIPLYVEPNWERLTALLKDFPKLTLIVTQVGPWGLDRYFRPLLDRYAGVHLETSAFELDGGLPILVDRYGPERFLFGSGYHHHAMGGPSLMLRNLDIPAAAKARIGHGNLERLLADSRP